MNNIPSVFPLRHCYFFSSPVVPWGTFSNLHYKVERIHGSSGAWEPQIQRTDKLDSNHFVYAIIRIYVRPA